MKKMIFYISIIVLFGCNSNKVLVKKTPVYTVLDSNAVSEKMINHQFKIPDTCVLI